MILQIYEDSGQEVISYYILRKIKRSGGRARSKQEMSYDVASKQNL